MDTPKTLNELCRKLYYIKQQTNAGPNQGKWRVYHPHGGCAALGESRQQAALICMAFNLAATHPASFPKEISAHLAAHPATIYTERDWSGGRVYVLAARDYLDAEAFAVAQAAVVELRQQRRGPDGKGTCWEQKGAQG